MLDHKEIQQNLHCQHCSEECITSSLEDSLETPTTITGKLPARVSRNIINHNYLRKWHATSASSHYH